MNSIQRTIFDAGRGQEAGNRESLARFATEPAARRRGGWRIAKNAARSLVRAHERPVPAEAWPGMLTRSGFPEVTSGTIAAEAALVTGQHPGPPPAH